MGSLNNMGSTINAEKNITVLDTCQYTISGLSLLCKAHTQWTITDVSENTFRLIGMTIRKHVDLLICGVGNQPGDLSVNLNIPNYPFGRYVIFINNDTPVLHKLFTAAGFHAVISKTSSLDFIVHAFDKVMSDSDQTMNKPRQSQIYLPQERYVLSALLRGESPNNIAETLGISYRTVSRYKQSALKRAGINCLNEILTCQKEYIL